MSFDTAGFTLLNGLYPSAPPLWTLLNDPRAAIVLVLIAVAVLRMENAWRWALPAILTVMVSDVVTARVLKPMIDRDRPCEVIAEAYVPLDEGKPHCGSGAAMPSSHAANSMALGVVLARRGWSSSPSSRVRRGSLPDSTGRATFWPAGSSGWPSAG